MSELAGVVLAAGRGTRMRPLTDRVPKPLLTIDNLPLLRLALDRVAELTDTIAVNAHHLAEQVLAAAAEMRPGVHLSWEREALLGTAGALVRLREWIDGRPVVIANGDSYLPGTVRALTDGWDGRRPRLLVADVGHPADFGTLRFLGMSTLPGPVAAALQSGPSGPSGLYSAVWKHSELEFVIHPGPAFDCGTAAEFLTANLVASGGTSVIAPDAVVSGTLERSVVLAGGRVDSDEHLVDAIRDGFGQTLRAG